VISKILVATDFSEQAQIALAQATEVARLQDAELILLHVTPLSEPPPELEAAAKELSASGLRVTPELRSGHPDETIAKAAEELCVDLVVTGTHGRTGIMRFLLGSVAEKVVRSCPTNVLVSRPSGGGDAGFNRILVPSDFSPASEKALRLALALAAPNATVELFHSWQFPPGTHTTALTDEAKGPLAELRTQITTKNDTQGSEWVTRHQNDRVTLKFSQEFGPAAVTVNDRLDRGDYDLVAMGTHGYRGFRRFLLGSVAEATVRHAPCSVLVAHAADV
jgi:nucleotide-binding universal stress UspA family protein